MDYALSLKNVNVTMSKKFKLENISLNIPKGTICGLVGKNGAGKTTLIKTVMNMIDRENGTILYDGLTFWDHDVEVKKMMNCVFDDFLVNKKYRIRKYVKMLRAVYEDFDVEFYEKYMKEFGLDENTRIQNNSLGMQKKLNIILTMACKPKILILDEPTSSLDPTSRATVLDMLLDYLQEEENTVLFSTHITSDLDKVADYIIFIENGKITFTKEKYDLIREYTDKMGAMPTIEDIMVYREKERE